MEKRLNVLGELWKKIKKNKRALIRKKKNVKSENTSGKCDLTYSVEQQRELLHETKIT